MPQVGSNTAEPAVAQHYASKYNPIMGYFAKAQASCGGWGNWCCTCEETKVLIRRIRNETQFKKVSFWLNSTCCKDKPKPARPAQRRAHESAPESAPESVIVSLGTGRDYTFMWTPNGWVRLPLQSPPSDSFPWSARWDTPPGRDAPSEFLSQLAGTELARSRGSVPAWQAVGCVCLATVVVPLLGRWLQGRINSRLDPLRYKTLARHLLRRVRLQNFEE